MPGLDHVVSEMTKRSDSDPYGCANQPRKDGYYGMDRIYNDDGTWEVVQVWIPDRMSLGAKYDAGMTDPRCATCKQKHEGIEYDQMIRRQGR